ncbi:MAG TPA: NTP transferase domain-containing protein, partial [Opitutaceae bacterium]|nr:NTP transferase domain-containing protein [Opitutaceae bacterium]
WRRQVSILRAAGAAEVRLALRPGQAPYAPDVPVVTDTVADAGPLAGIHAALQSLDGGWLLVLAVDLPRLGSSWFAPLKAACRPGAGAVFRNADGFEPLAAIYPAEALAEAAARLGRKQFRLQEFVSALVQAGRMTALPLPEADRGQAENWNETSSVPPAAD